MLLALSGLVGVARARRWRSPRAVDRASQRQPEREHRADRLDEQHDGGERRRPLGGVQQQDRLDHGDRADHDQEPGPLQRQHVLDGEIGRRQHRERGSERQQRVRGDRALGPEHDRQQRVGGERDRSAGTESRRRATIASAPSSTGRVSSPAARRRESLGNEVEAGAHRDPDQDLRGDRRDRVRAREVGAELVLGGDQVDVLQQLDYGQPGDWRPRHPRRGAAGRRPVQLGPRRQQPGRRPVPPDRRSSCHQQYSDIATYDSSEPRYAPATPESDDREHGAARSAASPARRSGSGRRSCSRRSPAARRAGSTARGTCSPPAGRPRPPTRRVLTPTRSAIGWRAKIETTVRPSVTSISVRVQRPIVASSALPTPR